MRIADLARNRARRLVGAGGLLALSTSCGMQAGDGGVVGLFLGPAPADDMAAAEAGIAGSGTPSAAAAAAPPVGRPDATPAVAPPATPAAGAAAVGEAPATVSARPGERLPDVEDKLAALRRLRDRGLLSDQEYQTLRDRVSRQP